ncbi:hypothetical protein LTR84_009497 [Exophiala bonariae]|uniref:N-acetyltransferase domain-containing protein n=1 Tax=Exophiala bonariae TaxID=1690606 RepID=A0AAV9MUP6_9EURO|nr:hypothetical protein LTR84_009497 [Exophiala bonariae]
MLQIYTATQLLAPTSRDIYDEVVEVISLSFAKDPGTRWLFQHLTEEQYMTAVPHYFQFLLQAALQVGAFVVVSREDAPGQSSTTPTSSNHHSKIQAVAVVIPPSGNAGMNSSMNALRAGFFGLVWHCGVRMIWTLLTQLLPAMEALEKRLHPNGAERHHHFTLLALAARPEMQGKGLGKTLLIELQRIVSEAAGKTVFGQAAAEVDSGKERQAAGSSRGPAPLYLEASTPSSKRLYERVGFVARDTLVYGTLDEQAGKDLVIKEDGEVVGGRMFAMFWSPP